MNFVDSTSGETLAQQRTVGVNGEVSRREATQAGGFFLWKEELNGAISSGATGGLESVYQSVLTRDGLYEYYYDANNRRRLKVYPSGERDELHYRPDARELLSDVGNDEVYAPSQHPIDDYIWLDGKPVVVVRGLLNRKRMRQSDFSSSCGRNGGLLTPTNVSVGTDCGVFFPVTDPQGRIALVMDDQRRVAGVGESDPYGNVNQVEVVASTDHPYTAYFQTQRDLLKDFTHVPWAKDDTEIRTRVHYFGVDVEDTDDSWLEDATTGSPLTSALARCTGSAGCGDSAGRVTTYWVESSERGYGSMNLRFRSGSQTSRPFYGVAVDRIEYLRSEREAKPWWPALRLPGQYLDEETDLFENWNRYYDPTIGRYLSPEPLLQRPRYVQAMAQRGMSVPTYAYALNNPIRFSDRNGLCVSGAGVDTAVCLWFAGAALEEIALALGFGAAAGMGLSLPNNSPAMPPSVGSGAEGGSGSTGALDPGVGGGTCEATRNSPTGADRLRQCQSHCYSGNADALANFCGSLPAQTPNQRRIQQECYAAADALATGQLQGCLNLCARAFNWSGP